MTSTKLRQAVAKQIRQLADDGLQPVVVHGGGPFIKNALDEIGLEHSFISGLRVTTEQALPVVERTLTMLGKQISQDIGFAVGISGRDGSLLLAEKISDELGYVGKLESVNAKLIQSLLSINLTPVIAPLAVSTSGQLLNVNADEVAGGVAATIAAPVIFLSDVNGILDNVADQASLISEISKSEIEARISDGRIAGGMIPKVRAATYALNAGADYAIIADGREEAILAKVISGSAGTKVIA